MDRFTGHAARNIVRVAKQYRGKLHLVATGPLTNIAVALQLEPDLPKLIKSFTIMGGATTGGNVTPTAEFNFHCDPEAAHIVRLPSSLQLQTITSHFLAFARTCCAD